jgi:hypothetical protein
MACLPVKYLIEILVFDPKFYIVGRQGVIFKKVGQPVLR